MPSALEPKPKGPWSAERVEAFLADFREPLRLACNGRSGHPVLATLWFVPLEGRLWCATQRSASVVAHLARDPRCAFEASSTAPPYRGVRGRAQAALDEARGEEILRRLLARYRIDEGSRLAHFLLARVDSEVAISLAPETLVSWDFSDRMQGAT